MMSTPPRQDFLCNKVLDSIKDVVVDDDDGTDDFGDIDNNDDSTGDFGDIDNNDDGTDDFGDIDNNIWVDVEFDHTSKIGSFSAMKFWTTSKMSDSSKESMSISFSLSSSTSDVVLQLTPKQNRRRGRR